MAVSVPFTGGCACGAIRYECSAEPLIVWKCHCRDCQRLTGSAFTTTVIVPASAFTYTQGEPTEAGTQTPTGKMKYEGFCSACGCPVASRAEEFPDFRPISAASLDDPSGLEPVAEIWTASAQPWDVLNPALPKFEQMPTEEQMQELMTARS